IFKWLLQIFGMEGFAQQELTVDHSAPQMPEPPGQFGRTSRARHPNAPIPRLAQFEELAETSFGNLFNDGGLPGGGVILHQLIREQEKDVVLIWRQEWDLEKLGEMIVFDFVANLRDGMKDPLLGSEDDQAGRIKR